MTLNPFADIFAKNRAEELGYDVWEHFVVPPFYSRLGLQSARKSRVIVGGRGCGKTMLLRYLSHQTTFSRQRNPVPKDAISHIGLYWRIDTQFANVMTERGVPHDVWEAAFNHLLALLLGLEIVKSIESIADSSCDLLSREDLNRISFSRFQAFDLPASLGLSELKAALEYRLREFELWVANVRKRTEPIFLPGTHFLLALITELHEQFPRLSSSVFFVYLDEFENLLNYQQRIINTCLKHSESPLIFNIAIKRNAFETIDTTGSESVIDIADYRKHDLEDYLLEAGFELFAAEVLLLNLALANVPSVDIDAHLLRDPSGLQRRTESSYASHTLDQVRRIFVGKSHHDLALGVFENPSLVKRLSERIGNALKRKGSSFKVEQFVRNDLPEASIVAMGLLNRPRLNVQEILTEMENLSIGRTCKFAGDGGWIHNYFVGCLLWLYESQTSVCPFYSGFDTFCLLARGNLRHLLELCHKSLNQVQDGNYASIPRVTPEAQARAARQTSAAFLMEIPAYGRLGDRLHGFVLKLGSLFALAHRRPTQSEPEQCHFSITSGGRVLSPDEQRFLREAEKWSVLFAEPETKQKTDAQQTDFDYVLNPIYAPYFGITFRKRKKLELSLEQLSVLINGTYDEFDRLIKGFSAQWQVDETDSLPLFSFRYEM